MTQPLIEPAPEQVTAEDRDQLVRGAKELEALLTEREDAEAVLLEAMGNIDDPVSATSFTPVAERLKSIASEDASMLVLWVLTPANYLERLAWADENLGNAAVAAFLRKAGALHGPEFRRAYTAWQENPDTWSNFSREVSYDFVVSAHRLRIRIRKYSGEETVFEGTADSMLDLTTQMLITLNFLPTKDPFRPDLREAFLAQSDDLVQKLRAESESETAPVDSIVSGPPVHGVSSG